MHKTRETLKDKRILIVDPVGECLPLAKKLVDENFGECLPLAKKLVDENFEKTVLARSFEDLLRILAASRGKRESLDLLILSTKLPECTGTAGLKSIRQVFDGPLMLLMESSDQRDMYMRQNTTADDSFVHNASMELFVLKVERLLTRRILRDQLGQSTFRSETLFLNILAVMAKVLEAKDPNTRFHSEKVSMLASNIAREMGMPEDEVKRVSIAGILHDIGKMGIPEAILKKPGPLTAAERTIVEGHPLMAAQILGPIEKLKNAVDFIKHHHEHYDGSGYPDQLAGDKIPMGARIIHVAEAFDAMVTEKTYSAALAPEDALAEIQSNAGGQFDPDVVDVLHVILQRTGLLGGPPEAKQKALSEMPVKSLPQLLEELTD